MPALQDKENIDKENIRPEDGRENQTDSPKRKFLVEKQLMEITKQTSGLTLGLR